MNRHGNRDRLDNFKEEAYAIQVKLAKVGEKNTLNRHIQYRQKWTISRGGREISLKLS